MEGLLGNTQTLLAAIATLAILCLFVEMRTDGISHPNGNFIFQLIAAIGSDVNKNLTQFYNRIKSRAEDKKKEVYKRYGIVNKGEDKAEDKYLVSLCEANNRNDLRQKLLSAYVTIDKIGRKIFAYSGIKYQVNANNQPKFINYYNLRQEPQLIALMVFLFSVSFLLIDVFDFDLKTVVPFTWIFLLNVIAFSFMIWNNHFSHQYDNLVRVAERNLGLNIVCGVLNLLAPVFCFIIFLYLPFDVLSIVLSALCPVVAVVVICIPMFRCYHHKHIYPRTIVLKHMIYFSLSSLVGAIVLQYMVIHYPEATLQKNVQFFYDPQYVRWLLYSILLLDLIIIPLYGGYLHMKIDEWRSVKKVKRRISQYDIQLNDAVEELNVVVSEILKAGVDQVEPNEVQPTTDGQPNE